MREFLRKKLVHLKLHPVVIPKVLLVVACIIYTFQLSRHSSSVVYLDSKMIAIFMFLTTLASFMSVISFISVKRDGVLNERGDGAKFWPQTIITYLLLAVQLVLNIYYLYNMNYETMVKDNPVDIQSYMTASVAWTYVHIVALALCILAIAFLPLYARLLKRVDTTPDNERAEAQIQENTTPLEMLDVLPEENSEGL